MRRHRPRYAASQFAAIEVPLRCLGTQWGQRNDSEKWGKVIRAANIKAEW